MSEPIFNTTTERMYVRLPQGVRVIDAVNDYPLKRYISSIADIESEVDTLIERFRYLTTEDRNNPQESSAPFDSDGGYGTTSDLVDGATADSAWLPWLAQVLGVDISVLQSEQEIRDTLTSGRFQAGSMNAIIAAVQSVLTGTKYVQVYANTSDPLHIGAATMWDVLIVTRTSETPGFAAIVDMVNRKNAKPAGVRLYHSTAESTWDDIESALPTWDDWDSHTWNDIEEVGF
jgi:hypothetical protein